MSRRLKGVVGVVGEEEGGEEWREGRMGDGIGEEGGGGKI